MQSMCERGGLIAKDDYAALSQSPVAAASALAPAWVTSNHYAAPPRTLTTERATREERAKAATQPHPASCSPDILGGDRVHWSQAPKIWVCMAGTFLALRWSLMQMSRRGLWFLAPRRKKMSSCGFNCRMPWQRATAPSSQSTRRNCADQGKDHNANEIAPALVVDQTLALLLRNSQISAQPEVLEGSDRFSWMVSIALERRKQPGPDEIF